MEEMIGISLEGFERRQEETNRLLSAILEEMKAIRYAVEHRGGKS